MSYVNREPERDPVHAMYSEILAPYRKPHEVLGADALSAWLVAPAVKHYVEYIPVTVHGRWIDVGSKSVRLGANTDMYLGSGWNIHPEKDPEFTESPQQKAYREGIKESRKPTTLVVHFDTVKLTNAVGLLGPKQRAALANAIATIQKEVKS